MINFFRKKRKNLAGDNKAIKYMRYAVGEIVLVVIGILIALQINTWNNNRINRKKEVKYLKAIKQDLLKDIKSTTYNIEFRREKLLGTQKIIDQINGQEINNLTELGINIGKTLYVERFQPNNITFKEMVSSGNVNLISNDSIKKLLLELELLYQKNIFGIEHETFEYQEYLSKPVFNDFNIQTIKQFFIHKKTAEDLHIKREDFEELMQNKKYLNGCVISNWTSEEMIAILEDIENKSKRTIEFIDKEIKQR
jgi:Family of unknown function (DUF6090)